MRRILPVLALLIALGVVGAALFELDQRSDDTDLAIEPTILPSPSAAAPTALESPDEAERTRAPAATTRRTAAAPGPTEEVFTEPPVDEPEETVAPPRTPTPEPEITIGPIDASRGNTPKTGGGAVVPGLLIAGLAGALRRLLTGRRKSY